MGSADFDLRVGARLIQDVLDKLLLIPVGREDAGLHAGRLTFLLSLAHPVLGEGPREQDADGPPSGDSAGWLPVDRGKLVAEAVDVNEDDLRVLRTAGAASGGVQDPAIGDGVGELVDDWSEAVLLGERRKTQVVLRGSRVPYAEESETVLAVPVKNRILGRIPELIGHDRPVLQEVAEQRHPFERTARRVDDLRRAGGRNLVNDHEIVVTFA